MIAIFMPYFLQNKEGVLGFVLLDVKFFLSIFKMAEQDGLSNGDGGI